MITNCTLYFNRLFLESLGSNAFVVVADQVRDGGLYTASIWIGNSNDVSWTIGGSPKYTSCDKPNIIVDDILIRKFSGEFEFYIELYDIGLYKEMGWKIKKVENATIFQAKYI